MGTIFQCNDSETNLHTRLTGLLGPSSWSGDWFMVKNSVWRASQRKGACRFLCVSCLENRIGRKLSAADFMRSAKVNFEHKDSVILKPAKRLRETMISIE
jgi:hypothetical protein